MVRLRKNSSKAAESDEDSAAFFADCRLESENKWQDLRGGRGDVFGGIQPVDKGETGGFHGSDEIE